jgi:hypothetical protein
MRPPTVRTHRRNLRATRKPRGAIEVKGKGSVEAWLLRL